MCLLISFYQARTLYTRLVIAHPLPIHSCLENVTQHLGINKRRSAIRFVFPYFINLCEERIYKCCTMQTRLIFMVLLLTLLHSTSGLYFHMRENERKCFVQTAPDDTDVTGKVRNIPPICIHF